MIKRWLTPQDDRPDLTYNFFQRFNMCMVKVWLTSPNFDRPGYHLEFILKIQHVHGQKMIEPLRMRDHDLTYIFFLKLNMYMVKRWLT